MKKMLSIIMSIVLCISVSIGIAVPSFAKNEKTAFVVVSGMNTFPLYDTDGNKVYPMSTPTILEMVGKMIIPSVKFLFDNDYNALGDEVFPALTDAFEGIACDKNGDSIYDIDTKTFPSSVEDMEEYYASESDELASVKAGVEKYGAENTFFFNYDWRCDPLDHADTLNKFIKNIKSETKCDKIALAAYSMGGVVTCSYLYKYGSKDLDTIILCSTAFQGTTSLGSLFGADISLSMDGLINRLAQLTRDNTLEDLIKYLNCILQECGINDGLENFANNLQLKLSDRMYPEFITPIFGYMPGMWSLVNDDNYEKGKELMLDKDENAKLIKRIDEYHYNVQTKAEKILNTAKKDTNVYILAQYNMQGLPVSNTASQSNNDYLIDTEFASGGATCSLLGQTLGDDYVQATDIKHNHLSADGQIDASTCMFPEQTWFIRDMGHVDYPYGESTDFILWLADSDELLDVFDNEEYPQFMTYSYAENELSPLSDNQKSTTADIIFDILSVITTISIRITNAILRSVISAVLK